MEEVYKEIKLDENTEMRFQITEAYCGRSVHISKDYYAGNDLVKGYTFCMWDDYAFDAWPNNSDFSTDTVMFEIDINDPLFFCFHRLLEGIEELVIDSDEYEDNIKKLIIRKMNNNIELEFRSNYPKNAVDKFQIFIKNIAFDLRSKIDVQEKDTKERLFKFFEDVEQTLLEEYHQISIDEYVLMKSLKKHTE